MPHPSEKIVLTKEQIDTLREMARLNVPLWQMAAILKMSPETLHNISKRDAAVQYALIEGKASGGIDMRRSLYARGVGERDPENPSKWLHQPDFAAMKFWAYTQLGFKSEQTIDVNINDGRQLTQAERIIEIKRLQALTRLTDDTVDDAELVIEQAETVKIEDMRSGIEASDSSDPIDDSDDGLGF